MAAIAAESRVLGCAALGISSPAVNGKTDNSNERDDSQRHQHRCLAARRSVFRLGALASGTGLIEPVKGRFLFIVVAPYMFVTLVRPWNEDVCDDFGLITFHVLRRACTCGCPGGVHQALGGRFGDDDRVPA